MGGTAFSHRLAAILAADAVGYSRLMASDEHATLAALWKRCKHGTHLEPSGALDSDY